MAIPAAAPPLDATDVSSAPLTPIRFLQRSALVWHDRVATRLDDRETTYAELLERCERIASGLHTLGVRQGDRVAALLPNVPELLELHFAVPGSGAVLVPLNTRLTAMDYAYILEHADVRLVVASPELADVARAAAQAAGKEAAVIETGPRSRYEELATGAGREALGTHNENALFSINYTSGTTGTPKGVMYTHRGCYLHALGVLIESKLDPSSAYLWTLPMFHCHGWAYPWAVTAAGARHECLAGFDPAVAWRVIREHGVTHLCGAPTVVSMLVGAPEATALHRQVSVFVGGAPPAPTLFERARALGLELTHLYGLTETYGPIVACVWKPEWDDLEPELQYALRARQGVSTVVSERLRVVDEHMVDVPADGETTGEIVMRGNNVTIGYYRDPDATEAAFTGGWFHSGDVGVMHSDGYVQIRDRMKDVVVSGGENVSTIEVEAVLAAHPSVAEAAVVGVPDETWGEAVTAFVVLRARATADADELRDFARQRLARYKVPKTVAFVDELPKTSTGKVQKFVLRARA